MNNEKNTSSEGNAKGPIETVRQGPQLGFTTEEKAQYEVFRNGSLPRETVAEWINNDLRAILSFVSGVLNDSDLNKAIVDSFYAKYQKLHSKKEEK